MLRRIAAKARAFTTVSRYLGSWHSLLRVYYLGGRARLWLSIGGERVALEVDGTSVRAAVGFAKAVAKCPHCFEASGDEVVFRWGPFELSLSPGEIASLESPRAVAIKRIIALKDLAEGIEPAGGELLRVRLGGTVWLVRRSEVGDLVAPLTSYAHEVYEYREWFEKNARGRGLTFLDVGAHLGGYSVRACLMGLRVVAVEPDPDNYRLLTENLRLNGCSGAVALNIAAGDQEGTATLYSSTDSGRRNLAGDGMPRSTVRVAPLDALEDVVGPGRLYVKVDVEGYEAKALRGMARLLKRADYLFIETRPHTEGEVEAIARRAGLAQVDRNCDPHTGTCNKLYTRI